MELFQQFGFDWIKNMPLPYFSSRDYIKLPNLQFERSSYLEVKKSKQIRLP